MVKSVEYERMWQLLDFDLELLIQSGFIYLPLLFDPAIEREIHFSRGSKALLWVGGRHFIRSLSVRSLVANYEKIDPQLYGQVRSTCLQKSHGTVGLGNLSLSEKLRTIVFQVMPHFLRRSRSLERRKLSEDEILDLIVEKVHIPEKYYDQATTFLDTGPLRRILGEVEETMTRIDPPEDGLMSAHKLREWLVKTLEVKIVSGEKERLRRVLYHGDQFRGTQRKSVALLLYIAEKGGLEIDGFGFSRMGLSDDYITYKHTGQYALKDFYGRIYLFPDCKVGVSTITPLRPIVIDSYKHPFLEGDGPGQVICLRSFAPPRDFTAGNAIVALEEGINALLYGYSGRRRNGYHSLDRTARSLPAAEGDDDTRDEQVEDPLIPRRYVASVNFEDCRISRDHPKIASGRVEVTNQLTP
ncbi:MAG: hypothetical protein ACE5IQ_13650 [Candidatus Methylomirabilales bacterium]